MNGKRDIYTTLYLTYTNRFEEQYICTDVLGVLYALDETIPGIPGHSAAFNHRLMAPPAVHVSGRVMQTSVWRPRSTHWF